LGTSEGTCDGNVCEDPQGGVKFVQVQLWSNFIDPKLKEANNMKQFRPICLLGVDYKWVTKVLTRRLTAMADLMVSKIQTTFIPRRNILDGVVILHEMRTKKKGVILKLNFEKAYDKVYSLFC
jgi:hypothetical protein